jgi:VanZ family protein
MKNLNPWMLPVAWGAVILFLSLLPGGRGPSILFGIPHFDKVGHFIMYGIWAFLIFRPLFTQTDCKRKSFWLSFLIISAIGIALEFGQDTITQGRSFEYADMLANAAGAFVGSSAARSMRV